MTPEDSNNENDASNKDLIGGELILPTAMKIGETSTEAAKLRGFLEGMRKAYKKPDTPLPDRIKNVQEIVDAAEAQGASRDQIGEYLTSLGINAVRRENNPENSAGKTLSLEEAQKNMLKMGDPKIDNIYKSMEGKDLPMTFRLKTPDGKTIYYEGTTHPQNLSPEQNQTQINRLKEVFDEFNKTTTGSQKRVVFVEGGMPEGTANLADRFSSFEEAFQKGGEFGAITQFAKEANIQVISPDIPDSETVKFMKEKGEPDLDIATNFAFRRIHSMVREKIARGENNFSQNEVFDTLMAISLRDTDWQREDAQKALAEIKQAGGFDTPRGKTQIQEFIDSTLSKLNSNLKENSKFIKNNSTGEEGIRFLVPRGADQNGNPIYGSEYDPQKHYKLTDPFINHPNNPNAMLNKLSALISDNRDQYILKQIIDKSNAGYDIFTAFGNSHAIQETAGLIAAGCQSPDFPSQNNETQNTENEMAEMEPLKVSQIKENPQLEKRQMDNQNVNFIQEGDNVRIMYGTQEWYKVNGTFKEVDINGAKRRFLISDSTPDMAYQPILDAYTVNPDQLDQLKSNPDVFTSSMLHESGHDSYFSLNESAQRELNDLFLKDPNMQNLLFKFAKALYTDKTSDGFDGGGNYLQVHGIDRIVAGQTLFAPDGQKGIKDTRTLSFDLNGQQYEVSSSLLITEFISYMSSLEMGKEVFEKARETGRAKRGGQDPRYDILQTAFNTLQNNPQLKSEFDKFGIFKDNTSQFSSELAQLV